MIKRFNVFLVQFCAFSACLWRQHGPPKKKTSNSFKKGLKNVKMFIKLLM